MGFLERILGFKKTQLNKEEGESNNRTNRNEKVLESSGMLKTFCENNFISTNDMNEAMSYCADIEKINDALGIDCPIATFHSTGNAIIHKNIPEEKLNIVDSSKLYFVIRDYFRGSVMQNESVVNKLIMFFASYFDAPYEGDDLNGFFNNIAKAN